jgi:hypothetical protein
MDWERIGVAMRWSPLVAVAAGAAVLAVPAAATFPGTNGKIVFERPTEDGGSMFSWRPTART